MTAKKATKRTAKKAPKKKETKVYVDRTSLMAAKNPAEALPIVVVKDGEPETRYGVGKHKVTDGVHVVFDPEGFRLPPNDFYPNGPHIRVWVEVEEE